MRLRTTLIALASSAVLTSPRTLCANPFGYHEHDGFYVRASVGLASLQIRRTTERSDGITSVVFAGESSQVTGASLFTELSVGGTLFRGLVLCGTLLGDGLPATELKVASGSRIDLGTPLVFAMLGPSIDYFPNPNRGYHVGGGFGLATSTAGVKDPIFSTIGGLGYGFTLAIGYDLWTGDDWSVGVGARGVVARITGQQESNTAVGREEDTVASASLSVSVLYH